jgi:hypothetical protein
MSALRGHEVDLGIYLKALREHSRPHAEFVDLCGDEYTLHTINERRSRSRTRRSP